MLPTTGVDPDYKERPAGSASLGIRTLGSAQGLCNMAENTNSNGSLPTTETDSALDDTIPLNQSKYLTEERFVSNMFFSFYILECGRCVWSLGWQMLKTDETDL